MGKGPLGRRSEQPQQYAPEVLHAIPRAEARTALGLKGPLPFSGADFWTGYELSWLEPNGSPQVGVLHLVVPCETPALIESKSLKLYLNSLNQEPFASREAVTRVISDDLSRCAGAAVSAEVVSVAACRSAGLDDLPGVSVDGVDAEIDRYEVDPDLLEIGDERADETLSSDLLRSLCPVTGQPDWASLVVRYSGPRISAASLLRYIVSFRQHQDFHEACVERIFRDIQERCETEALSVWALYTRRGGLDISPFRSDFEPVPEALRTARM
jgi:7-cyano-7-deazaguanine reductase